MSTPLIVNKLLSLSLSHLLEDARKLEAATKLESIDR
jgi:hypothetical protein